MLRSKNDIEDAGEDLHNCMADEEYGEEYVDGVENEESFFVVLKDEKMKPIAVGRYGIDDGEWIEILEKCNKAPSGSIREAFENYEQEFILPWLGLSGE